MLCRGVSEQDLLRMAAAVEAGTRHPIADAVLAAVGEQGIDVPSGAEPWSQPGSGARATVDGREVSFTGHCPAGRQPVAPWPRGQTLLGSAAQL